MELLEFIVGLILGLFFLGMCLSAIAFIIQVIIWIVLLFIQLPDWIKGVIVIIIIVIIIIVLVL